MPEEATKKNHRYTVFGDLMSEKSSENYPTMVLCEDCKDDYEVVTDEGATSEPCDDCGHPL
jgi:hypothetical protein